MRLIGIMGTPVSSGNRGVLALGASLINLCTRPDQGGEVVLLLGHRDSQPVSFRVNEQERRIRVVNCRLAPRSRPRDHLFCIVAMAIVYRCLPFAVLRRAMARSVPWIGTLAEAELVGDIRGGDSFSDIYGMRRFLLGFLMAWTVILVKGDMVQFPQTFGPFRHPLSRGLTRYLLRHSSTILARDRQSLQVAQDLAGPKIQVLLSPDVAFSLEAVHPPRLVLDPPYDGPIPRGVIGLNVNGLMYNGGYTRDNMFGLKMDYPGFLRELVGALLAEHPGELWLVPHTYASRGNVESDNEAAGNLRDSLPAERRERVRLVAGQYDQHEIKWIIGQCDFFVGARMHACIAALSQGVPCIGVAYSMKFAGVFETVGMQDWVIEARTVDGTAAVGQVLDLYRGRQAVRAALRQQADDTRRQLNESFSRLLGTMQSPPTRTE